MNNVKVILANGPIRVELEGPQDFVTEKMEYYNKLVFESSADSYGDQNFSKEKASAGEVLGNSSTLKSFLERKNPLNSSEAIACAVSYLIKTKNLDEVLSEDIRKALLFAKFKSPSNFSQALTDCKGKHGYIVSGSQKGMWKLGHEGENLVEIELPRTVK